MKTTSHTPGPWTIEHSQIRGPAEPDEFRGPMIASVHDLSRSAAESEANARLIAAAPELLQVARDYVLLCDLHDMEGAVLDAARAAIAKATTP